MSVPLLIALLVSLGCSNTEPSGTCDPETNPDCQGPTVTSITSDNPDPSVIGQDVTVEFSVESAGGTPTGTVEVSVEDGGVERCSASATLGRCTIKVTSAGSRRLRATYQGGGGFEESSDSEPHQVNKAGTTTVIDAHTPEPSVVGQEISVDFSVNVNPPGGGTPTGNVTVSDGTDGCTVPVRRGSCAFTPTTSGSKPLTVTYAGDESYAGSSDTETHEIHQAATTTQIVSHSPDPSPVGQAVLVVYSVTIDAPGSGSPAGNVTVSDGTVSCTASVEQGRCSLIPTVVGEKTITATYAGNESFAGSQDSESHLVVSATTTVTVTDSPDPSVVGQSVRVNYSVSGNGGNPTGNVMVTVDDGTDASCTGAVAEGGCDIVLQKAGGWTLTAFYEGDDNYDAGAGSDPHTVNRAGTRTEIVSDNPDPSGVGQGIAVNYSVTVTAPGSGTPTGNVTVSDGTVNCTAPVASGTCNLVPTTAGVKTLTATYAGDANFSGSQDTESHVVQAGSTTVTITSDNPDPSVTGQPVDMRYTVTGQGAGTPTGTVEVTVNDGSGAKCSSTVAVGGCQLTLTRAGSKTLTATYSGDGNFNPGSGTAPHTVNKAQTTTTITSDQPDPSIVNQAVTVMVSVVANAPGAGTPTGVVSVGDGTVSCNVTLSGGQGNCQISPVTPGTKTITANYAGDNDFAGSQDTEPHEVQQGTTTMTITADQPDPSVVGEKVTVEWNVTSGSGSNPSGTVTVTVNDGTGATCSAAVNSKKCQITLTTAGSKMLKADYSGDSNNAPASDEEPHTVNKASTSTAITSRTPSTSVVGQAVVVNFSVSVNAPGAGTPTGNVTVSDGAGASCSATVAQGNCTLVLTSAGTKTLTASYAGDANFANSSGNVSHPVNKAETTTTITSDEPDPSTAGSPITVVFSVSVTSPGDGTPTGNVSVGDGVDSCQGSVASNGTGSCQLALTTAGPRSLTATYQGDSNFNQSTSPAVNHQVN